MFKGKTRTGFEFEIEEESLDDFELLEKLCAVDNGDVAQVVPAITMLLGEGQKDRLKEHCRNGHGHILNERIFGEFAEILSSIRPGKNC